MANLNISKDFDNLDLSNSTRIRGYTDFIFFLIPYSNLKLRNFNMKIFKILSEEDFIMEHLRYALNSNL